MVGGIWEPTAHETEYDAMLERMERERMTPQRRVFAAVQARGYTDGWTEAQFVARQVSKLVEELAEVAHEVPAVGATILIKLADVAEMAREEFDEKDAWTPPVWPAFAERLWPDRRAAIASELADLQVVLFAAAERMGVDIVALAVEKAEADVKRGVQTAVDSAIDAVAPGGGETPAP